MHTYIVPSGYALAFEDRNPGDADYNDLVIEVPGVTPGFVVASAVPEIPVQAAIPLAALMGAVVLWLRKRSSSVAFRGIAS